MSNEPKPEEVEAEVVKTPGPIPEGTLQNFETMRNAMFNGDLALVSAIRKSDQKRVTLICAMSLVEDDAIMPVPLGEMIECDPYETYEDPTV